MDKTLIDKLKEILNLDATTSEEIKLDDTTTDPNAPSDTPTDTTPAGPTLEELTATVEDLQSRVTNLEALVVTANSNTEKLSKVIDIIKNEPTGTPITKTDVSTDTPKVNSKDEILKSFGMNLNRIK